MSYGRSYHQKHRFGNAANTATGLRLPRKTREERAAEKEAKANAEAARIEHRTQALARHIAERQQALTAITLRTDALEQANAARAAREPPLEEFAAQLREAKYPHLSVGQVATLILQMQAEHAARRQDELNPSSIASLQERLSQPLAVGQKALINGAEAGHGAVKEIGRVIRELTGADEPLTRRQRAILTLATKIAASSQVNALPQAHA